MALSGHPEAMKIGAGRCHRRRGLGLVCRQRESPSRSVTQELEAPRIVALEHGYQTLYQQAPSGSDPIFIPALFPTVPEKPRTCTQSSEEEDTSV